MIGLHSSRVCLNYTSKFQHTPISSFYPLNHLVLLLERQARGLFGRSQLFCSDRFTSKISSQPSHQAWRAWGFFSVSTSHRVSKLIRCKQETLTFLWINRQPWQTFVGSYCALYLFFHWQALYKIFNLFKVSLFFSFFLPVFCNCVHLSALLVLHSVNVSNA